MDSKRRDYVDPSRGYVRFFHQDFMLREMAQHEIVELQVRVQIEIDRMTEKLERIALEPADNPERVIRINKGIRIRRRQLGAIEVEALRRQYESPSLEGYVKDAVMELVREGRLTEEQMNDIRTRATNLAIKGRTASRSVHSPTCSPKARHETEDAAQDHLDDLVRLGKADGALAVYPCDECKGWHIGHESDLSSG